ncbi:MAG: hypothetical protein IJG34_07920 [Synergistaceae bacterium]|nr:hypothetical protein [Synergistaceae bacterium]MBQ3449801.1 hypothetical protein [Synergistaceae bacterium]
MMKGIKRFIKKKFINESHPFLWSLWFSRVERRTWSTHERHKRMSYAEIEAEISRQYERVFGRKLNWDNPQTYNEKINVSKVYMPTPEKTRLSDKYLVREWIREKIGEEYLIPLLGVYDSFDEIDFDSLPDKFVIKCNHDSGSVTLVREKSRLNMKMMKHKYNFHLRCNYAYLHHEMQYRDIKPRIIVEKFMGDAINDYKFLCFGGKPHYCWVDFDRYTNHKRNMYNLDWELQPFNQWHYGNYNGRVERPECFDEMKRIAEILCEDFGHVRVDLYICEGRIYFGEMTFSNGNGFEEITPEEWSLKLGELWPFDNTVRRKILSERTHP